MSDNTQAPQMPTPNPMLEELQKFVGTWELKGAPVGAEGETIKGTAKFEWLPGKFFLKQTFSLNFMGMQIESLEIIGYDEETKGLKSTVFSNLSGQALPYFWEVKGNDVMITVNYGMLDATFHGKLSEDGIHYNGGWRPNEGADTNVNVPYDLKGVKIS